MLLAFAMFGSSPDDDTLTEENCQVLYRPPGNGEEEARAHRAHKITRKQVYLEKAAEDESPPDSNADPDGHMRLSRRELERRGSVLYGQTRTRFYRKREEAMDAA